MGHRLGTEIGMSARDFIDKELDVAAWVEARQSYMNNFNSNAVGDSPRSRPLGFLDFPSCSMHASWIQAPLASTSTRYG